MAGEPVFLILDDAYFGIALTSGILGICLSTMFAIWHVRGFRKSLALKKIDTEKNPSTAWSIPFAIYPVPAQILWLFDILDPWKSTDANCYGFAAVVGVNILSIFKLNQHLMLIARLNDVYGDSALGYSKKKLMIWAGFLIFWTVMGIILQLSTTTAEAKQDQIPHCHLLVHGAYLMQLSLFDIVAGLINGYLFVKPINTLRKEQDSEKIGAKLRKVSKQQMVLSLFAICSSIVSIVGFALMDIPQFNGGLDMVLSTLCILLMFKWNYVIYRKLCCCFITKITKKEPMKTHLSLTTASVSNPESTDLKTEDVLSAELPSQNSQIVSTSDTNNQEPMSSVIRVQSVTELDE